MILKETCNINLYSLDKIGNIKNITKTCCSYCGHRSDSHLCFFLSTLFMESQI